LLKSYYIAFSNDLGTVAQASCLCRLEAYTTNFHISNKNAIVIILKDNKETRMNTEQLIHQKISQFPPKLQQQVLDFIEILENKLKVDSQETLQETDEQEAWEVFLTLEKNADPSHLSDISTHHDRYLYQRQ
jgi:hypothetical protein